MKHVSRFVCAAVLLLASSGCADLPLRPSTQATQATLVPQPGGLYCTEADATLSSGALFRVCVNPEKWNGDVVAFIPGYRDPARELSLPDDLTASPISFIFTELGYAFAATSFRSTGLIESGTWVGEDLVKLVDTARVLLQNTTGRGTRFVYQTGGSQGGLGTVMAVERYPSRFSGGLAACGPIGDYRRQIDYVADFRVLFDYHFAGVIPAWPVWRQDLLAGDPGYVDPSLWPAEEPKAAAALDDPSNAARIQQVLGVGRAPTDPANPASIKATTLGILWYSFRGTNDAIAKLGGMPFGNVDRVYSGSLDDAALNAGVERFQRTADATKLATLQTSAQLRRPLVTMHTTGDPIVPVWHQSLYRNRLSFFGKLWHTPITIKRYGHCTFTDAELLAAFAVLVLKVTGVNLVASSNVLPQPRAQADFLRLAREHGASPVVMR
jgi:hypothetical protein